MDHVLAGIVKDRTVILVTHNKTSLGFCDRIYLMEQGRLQEIAKDSLHDIGELDAVVLDDAETSISNVDEHRNRLSFSSERNDSTDDFEEDDGREIDVLDGAASVMVAESTQDHRVSKEPVEMVSTASEEVNQKKGGYSGSADGRKLSSSGRQSGFKRDKSVNRGGQLTVKEDRVEGEVTWGTYAEYAKDGGG